MRTSNFGSEQVLLRIIAVLAGIGVFFNTPGDFARADANPLCATPELYDLDGSGMVTPADILALIDGMNGPDPQSPRFDIDGSGEVNELDIDALAARIEACRSEQAACIPDGRSNPQVAAGEPQVVVTLTPTTPGPYAPGQQITIVVSLQRAQATGLLRARLIQFDLVLSNPALGISYPVTHSLADVGPITFWDFSSTPICTADPADCGAIYFIDGTGPLLNTTYTGLVTSGSRQITIPADATSVPVGLIQITFPSPPGIYRLDVMNAANLDPNLGAEFRHGFGSAIDPGSFLYRASTGEFAGGILDLVMGYQECLTNDECLDDGNECTDELCVDGVCQYLPKDFGAPCGNPIPFGICDLPDRCDGNGLCSLNFATSQVVCRAPQDECDQAEHCTGQSANCPSNDFSPPGTPCADDGMECTSDSCLSGVCVHAPRAAGTPCGQLQPQGDCDMPDTCNGTGVCSPDLTPSGTVCRAATSGCDQSEYCNGLSPACPADLYVSNGTPCTDDGDECTNDVCDGAGQCAHDEIVGCRAIPAVSTWGFVILSLVLMVGAKLRFRIRSPQS